MVPLVTILSAELVLELRTGPVLLRTGLVLVLRTVRLPERVLVLVLPTMPQRLPLLQPAQVPPRLAQGKVKAQEMVVANRVVVACIWVTMKPALGVTTELRDSHESVGRGVRCYSAASFSQLLVSVDAVH